MKKIDSIFSIFSQRNPHPKIELNYTNNYTLLVAVVLSAQSTDVGVNKVTAKLFQEIESPLDIIKVGEDGLKQHIKRIGLYNSKAKNIMALSQKLLDDQHDDIPRDFEYLISLPGVGRKSANVILNSAFGQPTIGVDTHVFRVSNRLGITKSKNVLQTEQQLTKKIPAKFKLHAHHWLVLHGRYICKARKPNCEVCFIRDYCAYYKKISNSYD